MMVKDHTEALAKLRPLPGGDSSGVKPDGKHQQAAERLAKSSGAEFVGYCRRSGMRKQQVDC